MRVVKSEDWQGSRADLEARVDAFAQAKAAHRLTVNVPAPLEEPLVESLAAAGKIPFVLESELPEPVEEIELPDAETDRLRAHRWLLDVLLAERVAIDADAPDYAKRAAASGKGG